MTTHDPTPIRNILRAHGKSQRRVFAHDRSQTVGASEVGQCLRRQAFAKLGATRDPEAPEFWGASLRGCLIEDNYFYPALRQKYRSRMRFAGPYQRTFIEKPLSATPDALILRRNPLTDGGSFLVECKSIDPRTERRELKPEHEFQAQVQLGLVRRQTPFRPRENYVVVVDAANLDQIEEYVVSYDDEIYDQAVQRAHRVMSCRDAKELPAEGVRAGGKECGYCPYTHACGQARADAVPKQSGVLSETVAREIEGVALQAKALRSRADDLELAAKGLEERVRGLMHQAGTKALDTEQVQIRWSTVAGRRTIDIERLDRDLRSVGLALPDFQKSGAPSDRLTIKALGNGAQATSEQE